MNEMREVRDFRSEIPASDPESLFAARNRLTEYARADRGGLRSRIPSLRRPAARAAAAGVLSLALAGGVIVSQTVNVGGGAPPATARADVVLQKAAAAASAEPPAQQGDVAYLHTRQIINSPVNAPPTRRHVMLWWSLDGSQPGLRRSKTLGGGVPERLEEPCQERSLGALPPGVRRELRELSILQLCRGGLTTQEWKRRQISWKRETLPSVPAGGQESDRLVPGPSYAYLRSLPDDPDKLAARIRQAVANQPGSSTKGPLGVIGMVLTDQVVPPRTAAAMFRAAQRFDGIQVDRNVTLRASGKRGVAVTHTSGGIRTALVFDPQTYDFLGVQRTATRDRPVLGRTVQAGTVLGSSAIVEDGLVDEVGRQP